MKNWVEINGIFYNMNSFNQIYMRDHTHNHEKRYYFRAVDGEMGYNLGWEDELILDFSSEEEAREYLRTKLKGE